MMEHGLRPPRLARIIRRRALWLAISFPLITAGVCGWLTAPLEPPGPSTALELAGRAPSSVARLRMPDWPSSPLQGQQATILLLSSLMSAHAQLEAAGGYTAVFRKTERISGKLSDEQVMDMKARVQPFAVYFKFRTPETGKEVVYAEGRYDNNLVAHGGGLARRFFPRLKVAPDSTMAMMGNRHPITEAGLVNLLAKLIHFRRLDLEDPEAVTVLDRVPNPKGGEWLRSIHTHPHQNPSRPFQKVVVLYDPVTRIPVSISNYEWAEPGSDGELPLTERYTYDDLDLSPSLTDLDFDPANPAYDFTRF